MGIFDKIKGQLIDVIEWTDSSNTTMVHKYDMNGKDIMMGAPGPVENKQLEELHIRIAEEEKKAEAGEEA